MTYYRHLATLVAVDFFRLYKAYLSKYKSLKKDLSNRYTTKQNYGLIIY
uniref:Uncharacterized protein n=2 Tax=unclassified Caudoviricetes TaxID=2788787 RepID=A0A8S5PHL5_9CAUD|nr:MAG TPA: hypothetical protein [Siphoviridae sp. ctJcm18]DAE06566.1 MAG TPA: hypothetical protein [Siphoviridae sp. ctUGQ45]